MNFVEPSGPVTGPEHQGGDAAAAVQRTHDLRASLEAIVSDAERMSEELVAESRAAAAATTREADERASEILEQARTTADVIRTRAETEVEDYRRRVRAELVEQVRAELRDQNRLELAEVRAQSQAVIGDLEASVRILGVSMESAVANIAEMLSALEQLRSHTADPMPQTPPQAPPYSQAQPHAPSRPPSPFDATHQAHDAGHRDVPAFSEPVSDSLGDPEFEQALEPDPVALGSEASEAETEPAPMTASEAFLRASSLEGDSPVSPERRPDSTGDPMGDPRREVPEDEDADQAKPLGWLFRSPD